MKIIVCIKQVPDATEVRLNPETNTLTREGVAAIMNPYDQHALEEAVRLREKLGGGEVIALTMGPPQAEGMLRDAVALGADRVVLVSDRAFAGSDTWATSYTLEHAVNALGGADLILCGKQAIDGDTGQVGPGMATRLGIPFITCVQKVREVDESRLVVERMMDDGYDVLAVKLPALLTVVKNINEPRVPSLKGKMKAKKVQIEQLNAETISAKADCIGLPGSPTQVAKVFAPEARGKRIELQGTLEEQLAQLAVKLVELARGQEVR
ncbi:MAG: electron transfer flavoprotein subunit beta/FixA family protein [Desulforhopalus sp.]|nr:electron transfer flavoprotein subunit beta/FixA family protein [Desulforhopalus sp.]